MLFKYETINCQEPPETRNIHRVYKVVRCIFNNKSEDSTEIYDKAWDLAKRVNPHKANDSTSARDKERLVIDALGGVLAEYGWLYYIRENFGVDAVSFTEFNDVSNQIDLLLKNGKSMEVRSSFPRNGIKFAICNERHIFKNICKYDNLYKPSEVTKDFFASVLFKTPKFELSSSEEIIFYLIGGSTRDMMLTKSFESDLVAEDDLTGSRTRYKVIKLSNALDMAGFDNYLIEMEFQKIHNNE